jgi:hypothetical protein
LKYGKGKAVHRLFCVCKKHLFVFMHLPGSDMGAIRYNDPVTGAAGEERRAGAVFLPVILVVADGRGYLLCKAVFPAIAGDAGKYQYIQ